MGSAWSIVVVAVVVVVVIVVPVVAIAPVPATLEPFNHVLEEAHVSLKTKCTLIVHPPLSRPLARGTRAAPPVTLKVGAGERPRQFILSA